MADPTTPTDNAAPPADKPEVVQQTAANTDASNKGLNEVLSLTGAPGATATDTTKPAGDSSFSLMGSLESAYDGISSAASSAWDKTESSLSSWAKTADTTADKQFLDVLADIGPATGAGTDTTAKTGSDVTIKDGQATVDNKDLTATRDANGKDTVTEKSTGDTFTRNADHSITEQSKDQTTTIDKDNVKDKVGDFNMTRALHGPIDPTKLKPGEGGSGSNGVAYSDAAGGGTAFTDSHGKIHLDQNNGDTVVLNSKTHDVEFTAKGGKPQHMTLDQFTANQGKSEFGAFKIDSDSHVTNIKTGTTISTESTSDGSTKAVLTHTDSTSGGKVTDTVSSDGNSKMVHTDSQGTVLSESTVNYNDPKHAYQQLDSNGKVTANYDSTDHCFSGRGFHFDDKGMCISDGNVTFNDDGTFTTDFSDSLSTDGSYLAGITGGESVYADFSFDPSQPIGLSVDGAKDLDTMIVDALSNPDSDKAETIKQLSGGKVDLSDSVAEAKDDRRQQWLDRKDQNNQILDFGSSDIYGSSAA